MFFQNWTKEFPLQLPRHMPWIWLPIVSGRWNCVGFSQSAKWKVMENKNLIRKKEHGVLCSRGAFPIKGDTFVLF